MRGYFPLVIAQAGKRSRKHLDRMVELMREGHELPPTVRVICGKGSGRAAGQAALGVGAWSSRPSRGGQVDDGEFTIGLGDVI